MSEAFVWFHNSSHKPSDSAEFYASLLGWKRAEGPPGMTMLAGEKGPFAGVGEEEGMVGWIPYAQVDDVDDATKKAKALGGTVVKAKTRGPAGEFSIIRDPGGAAVALFYLVDCTDEGEALARARTICPGADHAIEVRPVAWHWKR